MNQDSGQHVAQRRQRQLQRDAFPNARRLRQQRRLSTSVHSHWPTYYVAPADHRQFSRQHVPRPCDRAALACLLLAVIAIGIVIPVVVLRFASVVIGDHQVSSVPGASSAVATASDSRTGVP